MKLAPGHLSVELSMKFLKCPSDPLCCSKGLSGHLARLQDEAWSDLSQGKRAPPLCRKPRHEHRAVPPYRGASRRSQDKHRVLQQGRREGVKHSGVSSGSCPEETRPLLGLPRVSGMCWAENAWGVPPLQMTVTAVTPPQCGQECQDFCAEHVLIPRMPVLKGT